jgi:hypothetical protein
MQSLFNFILAMGIVFSVIILGILIAIAAESIAEKMLKKFAKNRGRHSMRIFTEEFEDRLVSFIGTAVVVSIALLFFGIAGGIELGLIF